MSAIISSKLLRAAQSTTLIPTQHKRRQFLCGIGLIGLLCSTGLISRAQAAQWNRAAFTAKNMREVLHILGGNTLKKTSALILEAPDISENGALVPLSISSSLPNVNLIAILIEKNPNALAAQFMLSPGTEANITTRVKMSQSALVHAVIRADQTWYATSKEIKVMLGGCGN